jgi:hypothetical protein
MRQYFRREQNLFWDRGGSVLALVRSRSLRQRTPVVTQGGPSIRINLWQLSPPGKLYKPGNVGTIVLQKIFL